MAAITAAQVLRIIDTDVSNEDITNAYIPMVDRFMAEHLGAETINDATDTQLRLLLAAHFISATRDVEAGSMIESKVDQITVRVGGALRGGIFGQGLRLTRYGQLAVELDPTGILGQVAGALPGATIQVVDLPDPDEE